MELTLKQQSAIVYAVVARIDWLISEPLKAMPGDEYFIKLGHELNDVYRAFMGSDYTRWKGYLEKQEAMFSKTKLI